MSLFRSHAGAFQIRLWSVRKEHGHLALRENHVTNAVIRYTHAMLYFWIDIHFVLDDVEKTYER